jgi:hypothetical protein
MNFLNELLSFNEQRIINRTKLTQPVNDATATPDIVSGNSQNLNAEAATQAAHEDSDYYSDVEI